VRVDYSRKAAYWAMVDVLAGRLPRLRSGVTAHLRVARARGGARRARARRRRVVHGSVFAAGADPSGASVVVTLRRVRPARPRRVRVLRARIRGGRYAVGVGRLGRGRWRVSARFPGGPRHRSSTSRRIQFRIR
jgi:hypothetical protein